MADIALRLGSDMLVVQGSMESLLAAAGFDGCLASLNLTEPEQVADIYRLQRAAGADCALSNTAEATADYLEEWGLEPHAQEISELGVKLAREAGFPHVLAVVSPARDASRASELYTNQARALVQADPDGFMLLGFTDTDDVRIAADVCRDACRSHGPCDLPIVACMSFEKDAPDEQAACAWEALADAGLSALGVCHMSAAASISAVASLTRAGAPCPTAFPDLGDHADPDAFADTAIELTRAGARLIGAGRGGTAACTGAAFAAVGGLVFGDGGSDES